MQQEGNSLVCLLRRVLLCMVAWLVYLLLYKSSCIYNNWPYTMTISCFFFTKLPKRVWKTFFRAFHSFIHLYSEQCPQVKLPRAPPWSQARVRNFVEWPKAWMRAHGHVCIYICSACCLFWHIVIHIFIFSFIVWSIKLCHTILTLCHTSRHVIAFEKLYPCYLFSYFTSEDIVFPYLPKGVVWCAN